MWISHMLHSSAFNKACFVGDIQTVKSMMNDKKCNLDHGLCYASQGGHIEIVEMMIEKGAVNFNRSMAYACYKGHMNIIKLMIKKGANAWNSGFKEACYNCHMDVIKLMIEKGITEWHDGFLVACDQGHIDIVKLIIERGFIRFWTQGLINACYSRHTNIIKLLIENGNIMWDDVCHAHKALILNLGINTKLLEHNDEFKQIINTRNSCVTHFNNIADTILYNTYEEKQIYDKNVLRIVNDYISF